MAVRFAVRTSHPWSPPGWIWVVVHDDAEQLTEAATRHNRRHGGREDHSETAACFQGVAFRVRVDDDGRVTEPASRYAGVLRILSEHGVATLAHECTHAAVALYGRQHAVSLDLHRSVEDEEVLCYAVGDLVGAITSELQARGVW